MSLKGHFFSEIKCKESCTTIQRQNLENHYKKFHCSSDYRDSLVAVKGNVFSKDSHQRSCRQHDVLKKQSVGKESEKQGNLLL